MTAVTSGQIPTGQSKDADQPLSSKRQKDGKADQEGEKAERRRTEQSTEEEEQSTEDQASGAGAPLSPGSAYLLNELSQLQSQLNKKAVAPNAHTSQGLGSLVFGTQLEEIWQPVHFISRVLFASGGKILGIVATSASCGGPRGFLKKKRWTSYARRFLVANRTGISNRGRAEPERNFSARSTPKGVSVKKDDT